MNTSRVVKPSEPRLWEKVRRTGVRRGGKEALQQLRGSSGVMDRSVDPRALVLAPTSHSALRSFSRSPSSLFELQMYSPVTAMARAGRTPGAYLSRNTQGE